MTETRVRVIDAYVYKRTKSGLKFLLLKRSPGKIYEKLWQCVSGKIENDEAAWETAVRELKEETGLKPVKIFTADHISSFYEATFDCLNLVPVFGIEVDNTEVVLSDEHSAFDWVTFKKAESRLVWSGQKSGIKAVFEMLIEDDSRMIWSEISLIKE